jgi:hypothetical protein
MVKDPWDPPPEDDEKRWPSVRRAYDFVLPSYTMLASRFEAADTRLTVIMNLAATLTLGAPLLAKSIRPQISFSSPWFVTAIVLFVIASVIGISGRVRGSLILPNPGVMYRKNLHKREWTFMKDEIYFAGVNFDANAKTIRRKGNVTLTVAILVGLEILALVGWVAR